MEPYPERLFSQILPQDPPPQDQDVRIVMFAAHPGRVQVMAECGTHPVKPVCGDGHSDTGPADENAAADPPFADGSSQTDADGRIITSLGGMAAKVLDREPLSGQNPLEVLLEFPSAMIAANGNDLFCLFFFRVIHHVP